METGYQDVAGLLPSFVYLERRDEGRNMARFYRVSVERDLFGALYVCRRFGRIGTSGRILREKVADTQAARSEMERLFLWKMRRGYRCPEKG